MSWPLLRLRFLFRVCIAPSGGSMLKTVRLWKVTWKKRRGAHATAACRATAGTPRRTAAAAAGVPPSTWSPSAPSFAEHNSLPEILRRRNVGASFRFSLLLFFSCSRNELAPDFFTPAVSLFHATASKKLATLFTATRGRHKQRVRQHFEKHPVFVCLVFFDPLLDVFFRSSRLICFSRWWQGSIRTESYARAAAHGRRRKNAVRLHERVLKQNTKKGELRFLHPVYVCNR
jgi:hypothetical protein